MFTHHGHDDTNICNPILHTKLLYCSNKKVNDLKKMGGGGETLVWEGGKEMCCDHDHFFQTSPCSLAPALSLLNLPSMQRSSCDPPFQFFFKFAYSALFLAKFSKFLFPRPSFFKENPLTKKKKS